MIIRQSAGSDVSVLKNTGTADRRIVNWWGGGYAPICRVNRAEKQSISEEIA